MSGTGSPLDPGEELPSDPNTQSPPAADDGVRRSDRIRLQSIVVNPSAPVAAAFAQGVSQAVSSFGSAARRVADRARQSILSPPQSLLSTPVLPVSPAMSTPIGGVALQTREDPAEVSVAELASRNHEDSSARFDP